MLKRALFHFLRRLPGGAPLPALARLLPLEPEARFLAQIGPCRGTALDVGANCGLYSYELAKLYDKVIAFEPNPQTAMPLLRWKSPRVSVRLVALSDRNGVGQLHVPIVNGVTLGGWASLNAPLVPQATILELPVEIRTLDSYCLSDVAFIKIDVEGHELEVLRGAEGTIRQFRPPLLLEVNNEAVWDLLSMWRYQRHSLHELIGVEGSPCNSICIAKS